MNRGIRKLVEGLFDDDIITLSEPEDIEDKIAQDAEGLFNINKHNLTRVCELMEEFYKYSWYQEIYKNIKYEIIDDSVALYYINDGN